MSINCGNPAHRTTREYLAEGTGRRLVAVHHESTEDVKRCHQTDGGIPTLEDMDLAAQHLAEAQAEAGYERWLEDGGPHAAAIQAEAEAEARDEARRGVIPFEEAMREAQVCSGDVHGPGDDECKGAHCVQPMRPASPPYGSDAYWDAEMQRREREEDERVAAFKAARDEALFS